MGRQKSSCLAPAIQRGTLHRQYSTVGQKVQIPGLILGTVALHETCALHAICICHVGVEVIVNAVLDENGLFNDFVN